MRLVGVTRVVRDVDRRHAVREHPDRQFGTPDLPDSDLSAREREVLSLLARGETNKEIAQHLGITESTVKCHVSVILMRLQATDRTQAVVTALQRGLVHL